MFRAAACRSIWPLLGNSLARQVVGTLAVATLRVRVALCHRTGRRHVQFVRWAEAALEPLCISIAARCASCWRSCVASDAEAGQENPLVGWPAYPRHKSQRITQRGDERRLPPPCVSLQAQTRV